MVAKSGVKFILDTEILTTLRLSKKEGNQRRRNFIWATWKRRE